MCLINYAKLGLPPCDVGKRRIYRVRLVTLILSAVGSTTLLLLLSRHSDSDGYLRFRQHYVTGKRNLEHWQLNSPIASSYNNNCTTGVPCVYEDEVDFRIIILTFNRAQSLSILLETLQEVELDGDRGALEIWIDRDKEGRIHDETLQVARSFVWRRGPTRVHLQTSHAGIYGQWIDTWRPKNSQSKEVALILEDDLSVSKYVYRWLKPIHRFYRASSDFAGASLTSDDDTGSHDGSNSALMASKNETIFMYKCIGTWGFSPKPSAWKDFQDWFHDVRINDRNYRPYVLDILPTRWYKAFEKTGKTDSIWEMWFIHFAYKEKLFTIYNNLRVFNGDTSSCLSINRREVGLHYESKSSTPSRFQLLNRWDDKFISLSNNITKLDWNGKAITKYD